MALSEEAELKLFSAFGFSVATEVKTLLAAAGVGTSPVFTLGTDATHLGFFGTAAAARTGVFTQTYATSSHTHAALTSATLTDSTGGTPGATLAAIAGSVYATDAAAIINALSSLAAQVNALRVDLANAKQVLNAAVDDLQLYGLFQ